MGHEEVTYARRENWIGGTVTTRNAVGWRIETKQISTIKNWKGENTFFRRFEFLGFKHKGGVQSSPPAGRTCWDAWGRGTKPKGHRTIAPRLG